MQAFLSIFIKVALVTMNVPLNIIPVTEMIYNSFTDTIKRKEICFSCCCCIPYIRMYDSITLGFYMINIAFQIWGTGWFSTATHIQGLYIQLLKSCPAIVELGQCSLSSFVPNKLFLANTIHTIFLSTPVIRSQLSICSSTSVTIQYFLVYSGENPHRQ